MVPNATLSLMLVALGHLAVELSSSFLPVLYPVLMDSMDLSYAQVGVIALVASIGTSVAQPLFGYLGDRWNPRLMAALSVAWVGLLMATVGLVQSYPVLLLVVGVGVLGSAAFHPPAALVATSGATGRKGGAVSVFSVGGNLGSALSPLLVTLGMGWMGTAGTLLVAPVALVVSGLIYFQLGRNSSSTGPSGAVQRDAGASRPLLGISLIVLTVMSLAWVLVSFKTYLPMWAQSQDLPPAASSSMLVVLLAALGVGSLLGGSLSDKIGRWQHIALCLGLLGPLVWTFLGVAGPLQWVVLAGVGIVLGATFPATIVLAQDTWPEQAGIASGLVMGFGWLPGGIGASVTGMIADRFSLAAGLRTLVVPAILGLGAILAFSAVHSYRARLAIHRS